MGGRLNNYWFAWRSKDGCELRIADDEAYFCYWFHAPGKANLEKSRIMDELKDNLWPRLESGEIKPIIEAVLPVTEAEKAHELIAGNETFGKVVLEVSG